MKSTCSFCQYLCYSKKKSQKASGDSWLALQSTVVCLFHTVISRLKISQSAYPSPPYPLCPLLKPVPTDSLPGVPIPRRHARCHRAKRPHIGCGESRDAVSRRITFGGGGGGEKMLLCVTLAGCLPSPLGKSSRPQLCLHTPTGYVTQCPTDIFPGRESEYEMIVLFTSYLLTLSVSWAAGSTDRAAFWQYGQCEGSVSRRGERKNPGNPGLTCSCLWCSVTYCIL